MDVRVNTMSVNIPTFDREDVHIYIDELRMWQIVTEEEKKDQGLLVWKSLPMNNIKRAIINNIGMEDLSKDDGMDKVLELVKKMLQYEEHIRSKYVLVEGETGRKWKKLEEVFEDDSIVFLAAKEECNLVGGFGDEEEEDEDESDTRLQDKGGNEEGR